METETKSPTIHCLVSLGYRSTLYILREVPIPQTYPTTTEKVLKRWYQLHQIPDTCAVKKKAEWLHGNWNQMTYHSLLGEFGVLVDSQQLEWSLDTSNLPINYRIGHLVRLFAPTDKPIHRDQPVNFSGSPCISPKTRSESICVVWESSLLQ